MNSVAEKKKIISDFIMQCNDYADGQVRKYQARLAQAGAMDALEIETLGGDHSQAVGSTNSRQSVRISGGLGDAALAVGGPAEANLLGHPLRVAPLDADGDLTVLLGNLVAPGARRLTLLVEAQLRQ